MDAFLLARPFLLVQHELLNLAEGSLEQFPERYSRRTFEVRQVVVAESDNLLSTRHVLTGAQAVRVSAVCRMSCVEAGSRYRQPWVAYSGRGVGQRM